MNNVLHFIVMGLGYIALFTIVCAAIAGTWEHISYNKDKKKLEKQNTEERLKFIETKLESHQKELLRMDKLLSKRKNK
jgi:hypothetical protein